MLMLMLFKWTCDVNRAFIWSTRKSDIQSSPTNAMVIFSMYCGNPGFSQLIQKKQFDSLLFCFVHILTISMLVGSFLWPYCAKLHFCEPVSKPKSYSYMIHPNLPMFYGNQFSLFWVDVAPPGYWMPYIDDDLSNTMCLHLCLPAFAMPRTKL